MRRDYECFIIEFIAVLNHKMGGRKTLNLYYKRVPDIIKLDKTKNKKLKQEFEVLQSILLCVIIYKIDIYPSLIPMRLLFTDIAVYR